MRRLVLAETRARKARFAVDSFRLHLHPWVKVNLDLQRMQASLQADLVLARAELKEARRIFAQGAAS